MAAPKASTRLLQYINLCMSKKAVPFLCWIDKKSFDGYNDQGYYRIERPKVLPIGKEYRKLLALLHPTREERDEYVSAWDTPGPVGVDTYWFHENDHRLMAAALLYTLLKEKGL
jgi:hypothetical protein